jgi:hypothetical protein
MSTDKPAENKYYDMSELNNVYFFSDLEGRIPPTFLKNSLKNVSDLLEVLQPGSDTKNFFENNGIVFCGDLIDRGAQSIRMLKHMKELKETYKDNVVLVAGNRDINKIRLINEFKLELPTLTKRTEYNLTNLLTETEIKLTATRDVFKILEDGKAWGEIAPDLNKLFSYNNLQDPCNFKDNVNFIFTKTMGCADYEAMYTYELNEILGGKVINDENIHKLINGHRV